MPRARDAVDLADEDGDPRHRCLADGVQGPAATADRPRALGLGADEKAGLVDEVGDRYVELVAHVDEPGELLRRVRGEAAGVVGGVGCEHSHRATVQPRKRRDQRGTESGADLEHRAAIENGLEDPAHLVRLARVARDDVDELLLAPVRRIGRGQDGRRLPHVVREIGEEAPELGERVVFAFRLVVDRTRLGLGAGAAELLLVGRLAHGGGDDRRPGDEELRGSLDDHREVRRDDAGGAQAGNGAEGRGDDRDDRVVLDDEVEAGEGRDVCEAHLLERLDAPTAAGTVDESHERKAQVVGHALGVDRLLPDGRVGRTAADREVVALEDCAPASNPALAGDDVGGQKVGELADLVVGALAREGASLVKGPGVEEALDPLPDGQTAGGVLALDALRSAHSPCQLLAVAKLGDLGLPALLVSGLLHGGRTLPVAT